MNKFQEAFARLCLKPKAECDLPGRLRMKFSKYDMLPKEALPYLHYVRDVLAMLPGVNDVNVNARIGTVLVLYDANKTNSRQIMRWVDIVVDTGIEIAKDKEWEGKDEAEIEQLVRDRLILRLPQQSRASEAEPVETAQDECPTAEYAQAAADVQPETDSPAEEEGTSELADEYQAKEAADDEACPTESASQPDEADEPQPDDIPQTSEESPLDDELQQKEG